MDEDELAELAEEWGVSIEEAADLYEIAMGDAIEHELDMLEWDSKEELADYLEDLAEEYDIDISDLYDMYYGYTEAA